MRHLLIYFLSLMHLDLLNYLIRDLTLKLLLQLLLLILLVLHLIIRLLQQPIAFRPLLLLFLYHHLHPLTQLIFMLTAYLVLGED
jgi:hypothetical protein